MNTVLIESLHNIGFTNIPTDIHAPLSDYGFDSLKVAMLVMELERTLRQPINLGAFSEDHFFSLAKITAWLESQELICES